MEVTATAFRNFISNKSAILLNKMLCKSIGFDLAFVLSDLADRDDYFEKTNPRYDGWFYSTTEQRKDELGIGERTLRTLMGKLQQLGYIETKMRGVPAKQYIKVNYELIAEKINSCEARVTKTQGLKKTPVPIEPEDENINENQGDGNAKARVTETQGHYINHTKDKHIICPENLKVISSLKKIVMKHYPNNTLSKNHEVTWNKEITKLRKTWKGTIEHLQEMLKVYYICFDRNSSYHTVIMSGESLRNKIDKLETFYIRNKSNTTVKQAKSNPKPIIIDDEDDTKYQYKESDYDPTTNRNYVEDEEFIPGV
jgi:hypothetical protein